MKKIICLSIICILFCSGCSFFRTKDEKPAGELVSDGMEAYEDGKYQKSIDAFIKLKEWYPFSKYASLAELKIAESYYHLKEYDEAVIAYEDFENLHPRNEAIPYIIYQIGNCYFEQMDSVDRDQSSVKKALDTYKRLIRQFPDDLYALKAEKNINECEKSLAGHELYVGIFYYKSKHYKPALSRFKSVVANFPDLGIHEKALEYIRLCEKVIKENKEKD